MLRILMDYKQGRVFTGDAFKYPDVDVTRKGTAVQMAGQRNKQLSLDKLLHLLSC